MLTTYVYFVLLLCALSAFSMGLDPFRVSFCMIAVAAAVYLLSGGAVSPQIAVIRKLTEPPSTKKR